MVRCTVSHHFSVRSFKIYYLPFLGIHDAAQNIAFMYSLYESCKLNDLNFFDYINDVLTRLMKGETDYNSRIPYNYKPLPKDNGEGQKETA